MAGPRPQSSPVERAVVRENQPHDDVAQREGETLAGDRVPTIEADSTSQNDRIAQRAYEIYCERGREHGHDLDDWLRAERETGRARTDEPPGTLVRE
jgi:hypothetical protein